MCCTCAKLTRIYESVLHSGVSAALIAEVKVDAFTASTVRHSNTFLRSVIHKVITHLQGWRRPTDAQDNTLEVCAKTQGERHCQNFRRLRRAEVTSSLRSQTPFFSRLAALDGPYFIEFDTKLIHLFGFWVGVLINRSTTWSWSALPKFSSRA